MMRQKKLLWCGLKEFQKLFNSLLITYFNFIKIFS